MDLLEAAGRVLRSPAFKFVLILFLIVLLLVPLALVYSLIWERENRAASVRREVGQLWGPEQRLLGPFLVVPYTVRIETVQGDKRFGRPWSAGPYSLPRCWMSRAVPMPRRCALHLRGACLCCAPEAVRDLRAAHRRCCGRGGGGALARCRIRARPGRCVRPQGGRNLKIAGATDIPSRRASAFRAPILPASTQLAGAGVRCC
jgi:hypothetical protein